MTKSTLALPEISFTLLRTSNEVVMIKRYELGYFPTREGNDPMYGQETADIMNADLGITKAQAKAMEFGSMFGWDIAAALPHNWNEDGTMKR